MTYFSTCSKSRVCVDFLRNDVRFKEINSLNLEKNKLFILVCINSVRTVLPRDDGCKSF